MAEFIILSICIPALIAVAGAIWYQTLQWKQFYEMKGVETSLATTSIEGEEEEEVGPARGGNRDRRVRQVLLVSSETLGTTDNIWRTEHAIDLEHAQFLLEKNLYDIIVAPLSEEAGEFMRWAAGRVPAVCRAVQCDEESPTQVFSVAPDAHLFLRSNSPAATIQEQLLRGTALNTQAIESALANHIGSLANLPALPATFSRLQRVLTNPDCSIDKVSDIIAQDLGLSAKVLQLVNAALVNRRQPIVSAEHAVKLVGLRGIRDLTLSVEVMSELAVAAPHLASFLEETQLRALRAAKLASRVMGGGPEADNAYSACLFHAIGRMTLLVHANETYSKVDLIQRKTNQSREDVEMELLGLTHQDVTAYLLRLWGLPLAVVEAAQFWHRPADIQHYRFTVLDATHVAMNLVLAFETGDIRNANIDHDLIYALHRAQSVGRWQIYAASICEELAEIPFMWVEENHA